MRRAVLWLGLVVVFGDAVRAAEVPPPFPPIVVHREGEGLVVEVWGRVYSFDDGPLPTRIESQGLDLLTEPLRIATGGVPYAWDPPRIYASGPAAVLFQAYGRLGDVQAHAKTRIEYDGMIEVSLTLRARSPAVVGDLDYELGLASPVARYYQHHLPYDYRAGFVDKQALLDAMGPLPDDRPLELPFVPTLAIGDERVGIEWWSESDAHWRVPDGHAPFRITPHPGGTRLRVRPIDTPVALDTWETWRDRFALFVFPGRPPPPRWRSVRVLPYNRAAHFDPDVGTRFLSLAMQDGFRPLYDGLPRTTEDAFQNELRAELSRRGVGYVPYGMLMLAPLLHPATMANFEAWSAQGSFWSLPEGQGNRVLERTHPEVGVGDPITYPACAGRSDYLWWILKENLETVRAEAPDALYFDHGGITRMCERSPVLAGTEGRQVWEYGELRRFYKRLYERIQAEAPGTLILTHTHGAPKAIGAFVDFHMVGEALNAVFADGRPTEEYRSDPSLYDPDYAALADGTLQALLFPPVGGVVSLIPQVKWAIDPSDPGRSRTRQRIFQGLVLLNDVHAPLWVSDNEAAEEVLHAVDRFGDLSEATVYPWWSNARLVRRPPGLAATLYVHEDRGLLVIASLGRVGSVTRVALDLGALGLGGARRVRDLERAPPWSRRLVDDAFVLSVRAGDVRLLAVE